MLAGDPPKQSGRAAPGICRDLKHCSWPADLHLQIQLKGHRSVGGMRASIYNSMPLEGVQQL